MGCSKEHSSTHHTSSNVHGNLNAKLALLSIQEKVKAGSPHLGQLPHDDVLRDPSHGVNLSMSCCLHQHIYCLLKRTSHEGPSVLPVDPVPGDGHQVALGSHHVAQHGQVAIVHVQTVEGQDQIHLFLHTLSDSLNTQASKDLADVITASPDRVHISFS